MTRKPIADYQSVVTVHGPGNPWYKWWHPLIRSLFTTLGAHVGQESCRAFSEQGPPTTSIVWPLPREVPPPSCWSVWRPCGLHLSCSRGLCPWQLARRPLQLQPSQISRLWWVMRVMTTHGPSMWVTFWTAIFQVLPGWLHITSSTQLPQLHPADISTQISFPFYLDQLHSLKLTSKKHLKMEVFRRHFLVPGLFFITKGVNRTTIDYLKVLIIEIGEKPLF